jgi:sugar lactone lactonase YvrE
MNRLTVDVVVCSVAVLGLIGCNRRPVNHYPPVAPSTNVVKKASAGLTFASLRTPRLGVDLTGQYSNPDGMTIKDGVIWISLNNLASGKPSCIGKIAKDNTIEKVIELPVNPETGVCSSLGIAFASDGNLYVSDNQNHAGKGLGKSRVLRVVFENDKAVRAEVVATGLHAANGLAARGDAIYVNETTFGPGDPMDSGTYRFKLSELKADAPVKVDGTMQDTHVVFTLKTRGAVRIGANGLCFDEAGNMYVSNFGNHEIWRVTFNAEGVAERIKLFSSVPGAQSVDGMQYDGEGGIWLADFMGNAIFHVNVKSGETRVVAKNPPSDGSHGELDAPSECIRLGNRVYVSNIDLTFGPHKADAKQTISIIDL